MTRQKFFLLIVLFTVLYIYMTSLDKIPEKIVLFQNENYEISHLKGTYIEGKATSIADRLWGSLTKVDSKDTGISRLKLSAFGGFFKKDIEVSVLPTRKVVVGGDTVGIRLYSKGVLVIGESPVQGMDGIYYEPYKNSSIKKGAKILKINNEKVETILELVETVANIEDNKKAIVQYEQDGQIHEEEMNPITCFDDGRKKLGLWVRDGAMGVGTLTFYDKQTGKIGALGHGISDMDLKELIDVDEGFLNLANIISVKKGLKNEPGEIRGMLNERVEIGKITLNNECGIYGEYDKECDLLNNRKEVFVASKNEIETGPATIYCSIDGDGMPKEYNINVVKKSDLIGIKSKGMIIEVTDEELLKKTGGIIQGMSGSPILQNGKFIGAVTHVYVNDPTRGYAIFAESMLEQLNELNNKV